MFLEIEDPSYRNLLLIKELLTLAINRGLVVDRRQLLSEVIIPSIYTDIFSIIRGLRAYYYITFLVTMIKVIGGYLATN